MNDRYKVFLQKHKRTICEGIEFVDNLITFENLLVSLSDIGWSCKVVSDNLWTPGKLDPTETSQIDRTVRIKCSYAVANPDIFKFDDEYAWGIHEMVHAIIFQGCLSKNFRNIKSRFYYPLTTDEIYCFGCQIKYLVRAGRYRNLISEYEKRKIPEFVEKIEFLKEIVS